MNPVIQKWDGYVDISGTVDGPALFISSGTPPDRDLTVEDGFLLLSLAYENFRPGGPWSGCHYVTTWYYLLSF